MKTETKNSHRLLGKALLLVLLFAAAPHRATPTARAAADGGASGPQILYYARFDIKSVNGVVTASKLLMIPAEGEWRAEGFRRRIATGRAGGGRNAEEAARRNAFTRLLLRHGLKSMDTKRSLRNFRAHDEIVISYEGVLYLPPEILEGGWVDGDEAYAVEMAVLFSPVADPDRWPHLLLRDRISKTFKGIISIFR